MNKENIVLTRMASESLKGRWGLAIGTFLVYGLMACSTRSIGN